MVKKKLFSNAEAYAAPVCNVLDVKVEGVMCQSPNGSWDNSIKSGSTWGSSDGDYGLE